GMKKILCLLMTAISLCMISTCFAEGYFSVSDVFLQAGDTWEETYDAHGRSIVLDITIKTPAVTSVPVIRIAPHAGVNAFAKQTQMNGVIQNNEAGFFIYVLAPDPMLPPKKSVGAHEAYYPLAELNDGKAYAEENALTLGQCKSRARLLLDDAGFQGCLFDLDSPCDIRWVQGYALMTARMREENKSNETYTGEAYGACGYYWLAARQTLHGIPLWRDIRWVYRNVRQESSWDLGCMNIAMDSADGGFDLCVKAADETAQLSEDIPLCSFEKVKETYEAAISEGNIRDADQLVFAYMIFRGNHSDDLIAYPCWVLRCRYLKNHKTKERDLADGYPWQNTDEALMLVVDAQSGEMIDPYDKSRARDKLPSYLTWQEVN
ncbi:MAG: hypothetical protein RR431_09215, partial [Clostridia bacterium]